MNSSAGETSMDSKSIIARSCLKVKRENKSSPRYRWLLSIPSSEIINLFISVINV